MSIIRSPFPLPQIDVNRTQIPADRITNGIVTKYGAAPLRMAQDPKQSSRIIEAGAEVTATFVGVGALTVTASIIHTASATFTGVGLLTVTTTPQRLVTLTAVGKGTLSATAIVTTPAAAPVGGGGRPRRRIIVKNPKGYEYVVEVPDNWRPRRPKVVEPEAEVAAPAFVARVRARPVQETDEAEDVVLALIIAEVI